MSEQNSPRREVGDNEFTRSFLKSRGSAVGNADSQRASGSKFFQDNRIRTCSYVKEKGNDFVAVPFYDKRDNKEYPTRSEWRKSWNASVHCNKGVEHAGVGLGKTLLAYDQHKARNKLLVQDFIPHYRNSSVVELGDRAARDAKYWVTTYRNSFTGRARVGDPTKHPGITAYRNRWDRHQISK
jgi:hypothetical protein